MEELDHIESPKSPKTPKLSEEVSEMTIKSPLNDSDKQEESVIIEIEEEKEEDPENNPELDKKKELLKQIIESTPAGQVQKVSNICSELFENLPKFIEKEGKNKMIKDGFIVGNHLITEDNYNFEDETVEIEGKSFNIEELKEKQEQENENSEDDEEFKKELKGKLENYVKELYPENGKFSVKKSAENEWKIQILAQKIKSKAFWSGHWRSSWTIKFKDQKDQDQGQAFSINGNVELIVHYHEEGTVQLSTQKEILSRVDFKSDSFPQAADKIYWKIKDSEDAIQLALNEAYQQLAENIFKKLRRQLPVTRTKMDWAKFANYNLATELKK